MRKIINNHINVYGIHYESNVFFKSDDVIQTTLTEFKKSQNKYKKTWLCEKTPKHVYTIDKIYKHIDNPKIIVMVRDGRDVVASLYQRYGDFDKSVNRWIYDNKIWLNNKSVHNFHIVKYEDFVNNPTTILQNICTFIGIPYYDDLLNYHKTETEYPEIVGLIDNEIHDKLRKYQINQDIYDGSGRYKTDLTNDQLNILMSNKNFVELMKHFEYI